MLVKLFLTLFLITSFLARAELKYLTQISEDLKQAQRPFAASYYLKKYLKENSSEKFHQNYEHLLGLIDLVGYGVFDDLSLFDTRKYPFAAMYYHSLKSLVFSKQFKNALKSFKSFPKVYREHPAFLQLAGFSAYQLNKNQLSLDYFKLCNKKVKKSKTPHFMSSKNYFLITQQCQAYLGREYYRQGKFRAALQVYNRIDKRSFYYPNTFTEKAWSYYQVKKYESVLGLNLASSANWLAPFYNGEIDLIAALSLIKLCRWDDVFYFLKQLHRRSNQTIANINKVDFFLEKKLFSYLINSKKTQQNLNPSLKRILNRFKLNSYWDKINTDFQLIQAELTQPHTQVIDQVERSKIETFLKEREKITYLKIRSYLFEELNSYRHQLYQNKAEADALELEVYSRYRNTLYKNKDGLDSLSDMLGKSTKIKKEKNKEAIDEKKDEEEKLKWSYENEQWRDELGQYQIKVPSKCDGGNGELPL